jgi:gliding motility-associated-like protein
MKLKTIIFCLLAFVFNVLNSQNNLVVNPSFEEMLECPDDFDQLDKASKWDNLSLNNPTCFGELYSTCSPTSSICHVPNYTFFGGQYFYQFPRTGNNFIAVETYGVIDFFNWRNYAVGKLKDTLKNGKAYCGNLYVNLSNLSGYAINRFGLYFDNGSLPGNKDACYALNINSHIDNSSGNVLSDTLGWMKIEGIYMAKGDEHKIILGNFFSNSNTNAVVRFLPLGGYEELASYNIDDVSVIPLDVKAWAGNDVTLCVGDTVRLGRPKEVGLECLWYTTTNATPFSYNSDILFNATEPGTYTLIQKMDNCQISFDTVTVTVVEDCNDLLTLPNVFTPNGDGTNDVFSFTLKNGTLKTFAVYNRWGNIIYMMDKNSSPSGRLGGAWDGHTTAGEPCNDGVYFYVLEYTDAKGELKTKRGYVSLMR